MDSNISLLIAILQVLANLAVVVTVMILVLQTRASLDASKEARYLRIAEIYRSVNLQFDDIISQLPPEINDFPDLASLRRSAEQIGFSPGQAEKAIWRYYDMVRMEFELCRMGVLTDHMWKSWLYGITHSFQYPAFREVWHKSSRNNFAKPPELHTGGEFATFMYYAECHPNVLFNECSTVGGLIKWTKQFRQVPDSVKELYGIEHATESSNSDENVLA